MFLNRIADPFTVGFRRIRFARVRRFAAQAGSGFGVPDALPWVHTFQAYAS